MEHKITLKALRITNGISANCISKMLGISRQTLSNKECGKTEWSAKEVQKLCEVYNVEFSNIQL